MDEDKEKTSAGSKGTASVAEASNFRNEWLLANPCCCGVRHERECWLKSSAAFANHVALRRLASVSQPEPRWISVKERLPELDKPVLIWRFGFSGSERSEFAVVAMLTVCEEDESFWEDWAGNDISKECVTHWQEFVASRVGERGSRGD